MHFPRGIAHPGAAMPLARPFPLVVRLALSLAALAVLATARLPEPSLPNAAALRVPVGSASPPASPAAWRVALALVLVAGVAAELHRRRAWH
jgi:hypothetical protein